MLPYWLIFGLFAMGALLSASDFRQSKPLGPFLWFAGIVLTLFIGLRYETGVDWSNYLLTWNVADNMSLVGLLKERGGDLGFYTLLWLLRNAGLEYWTLNLICAVVFTVGLFSFARRLPNPWLAVFIGVPYLGIVIAMSGTRQATAIGFMFLALLAFFKNNARAFLGWSAIAAAFHATAIVTVPLAGLSFAKNRFQSIALILIAIALVYASLSSRILSYAGRYSGGGDLLQSAGTGYRIAMTVLPSLLYFFVISPNVAMERHERTLWRNFSIAGLLSIPLYWIVPSSTSLDRTLLYWYPLQIFVLSFLPYTALKGANPPIFILGIILYFAVVFGVFWAFSINAESYIPYQIYWLSQ